MTERTVIGYIVHQEAHYRNIEKDLVELRIGRDAFTEDGYEDGCVWEFMIEWKDLHRTSDSKPRTPQVKMFSDSWVALTEIPEFFGSLALASRHAINDDTQPTVEDIIELCKQLGFSDVTSRVRGNHHEETVPVQPWRIRQEDGSVIITMPLPLADDGRHRAQVQQISANGLFRWSRDFDYENAADLEQLVTNMKETFRG